MLSIKVNSSGCITDVDGVAPSMLEWIAEKLQFTYSFLHIKDTSYDPVSPPELPGIGHYLLNEVHQLSIVTGS